MAGDEATRQWRKSSRSETGACVEIRMDADRVWIRSSTDLDGPTFSFFYREWDTFLEGIRRGVLAETDSWSRNRA